MSGASKGEHISVQLGNYANYVGTHFWNYQDELYMRCMDEEVEPLYKGHDIDLSQLYSIGRTHLGRETCTPRLLAVDRKENMSTLNPAASTIFKHESASDVLAAWAGPLTTIAAEPAVKNSFQRLLESENGPEGGAGDESFDGMKDSEVTQWSDFLKVHLHPKSLMPLPLKSGHTYDHFFAGKNVNTHLTRDGGEEVFDALRRMLEECDHLTCINMLADIDDGFGGLAAQVLEYLRDEVRGAVMPVWVFPEVYGGAGAKADGTQSKDQMMQRFGSTLATAQLSDLASILIPLDAAALAAISQPPHCFSAFNEMQLDANNIFHTSAVAASIIETVTGSQRIKLNSSRGQTESDMRENLWSPQDWVHRATRNNLLPVCNVDAAFGFPHSAEEVDALFAAPSPVIQYGEDVRAAAAQPFLLSVSSVHSGSWGADAAARGTIAHGLPRTDDGRRSVNRDIFSNLLFSRGSCSIAVRDRVISKCEAYTCVVNTYQHRSTPLPLPICFPDIFPRRMFDRTDESLLSRYYYNGRLSNMDAMVAVNTSPLVGRYLAQHAQSWRRGARGIRTQLAQAGCDAEESEEMEEKLMSLSERYNY